MASTSEVWVCMPTVAVDRAVRHIPLWKERGYKVALLQDRLQFDVPGADAIVRPWAVYHGYPRSCNYLVDRVVPVDVPLVCFAGDDMRPDPNHTAGEVLAAFLARYPSTLGVLQPVGDRWPIDSLGCGVDRICGSPFVGRAFIRSAFNGRGPWCESYHHFYADEEMHAVASQHGLLWQCPSMSHYHEHWTRSDPARNRSASIYDPIQAHWDTDKAAFEQRRASGFPGYSFSQSASEHERPCGDSPYSVAPEHRTA